MIWDTRTTMNMLYFIYLMMTFVFSIEVLTGRIDRMADKVAILNERMNVFGMQFQELRDDIKMISNKLN